MRAQEHYTPKWTEFGTEHSTRQRQSEKKVDRRTLSFVPHSHLKGLRSAIVT